MNSAVTRGTARRLLLAALSACAVTTQAQNVPPKRDPCEQAPPADTAAGGAEARRRPGQTESTPAPAECHADRMPTPSTDALPLPTAVPDRWRLIERLGRPLQLRDPYDAVNPLKGDLPVFGRDKFFNLIATSNSLFEARELPTTATSSTLPAAAPRTLMRDEQFLSQSIALDAVLYRGDTIFRPPDWQLRFDPVFNDISTHAAGKTASVGSVAIQGLSFEKHLRDASPHYDFDSIRVGIQPLTSDFRGFLAFDQPLAVRLFGTRANNRVQYNLVLFNRLAKNRARLNDLSRALPRNPVLLANLYWQDFPHTGVTSELLLAYSRNRAAATQALGSIDTAVTSSAHDYDAGYGGYSLDGHFGRLNLTGSLYGVMGRERQGTFVAAPTRIGGWFAATELSVDFDWWRPRLTLLHASGDRDPLDRRAQGFDGLGSTSLIAGADSDFFFHQQLALRTGGFTLKTRDALLPALRGAADSGQADFGNPGFNLLGLGADLLLTPRWTLNVDTNHLAFDQTAVFQTLLGTPVPRDLGTEFDLNAIWRPFATQNVILRWSGSLLSGAAGWHALYQGEHPFSAFMMLILNY